MINGYILEVDVQYLEQIHDLHSDLSFLPETIKSNEANLHEIMD